MTAPVLKPGVAIRYPGTGPEKDSGREHCCILVSGATKKGDILLVPICSTHANCDRTVVFQKGKGWDEIRHESYAGYYAGKKVSAKGLLARIEAGEMTYLGEIPADVFDRIIKGIEATDDIEPWFLKDHRENPVK